MPKKQKIECNLCGSPEKKLLLKKNGHRIVMCKECGLVYVDRRVSLNEISKFYQEKYFHIKDFKNTDTQGYRSYIEDREHHLLYFGKKIKLIKKFVSSGRILDIGCATGFFMEAAEKEGFVAYGVDLSGYAIKFAKRKFSKRAFCGTIERAGYKTNYFDAVTLFQTIEHLPNPLGTLREIYRVLKKGGVLTIATPNHDCLLRRVLRNRWFEYKPDEHLYFFNPKILMSALENMNFRVRIVQQDVFYYPLPYVLERVVYYTQKNYFEGFFKKALPYFSKFLSNNIRIPIPLGGAILVAEKL